MAERIEPMPRAQTPLPHAPQDRLDPSDEGVVLRWCGGESLSTNELEHFHRLLRTSPVARELCDAALPAPDDHTDLAAVSNAFVHKAFGMPVEDREGLSADDEAIILRWCGGEKLAAIEQAQFHRLLKTSPLARELCDAALPDPSDRSDIEQATITFAARMALAPVQDQHTTEFDALLRSVIKTAGMERHTDFAARSTFDGKIDSRWLPDVVVRLPGARMIPIDAKVPMNAYFDSINPEAPPTERQRQREALSAAIRSRVHALTSRQYARNHGDAVETFVLFIPVENALATALEVDGDLYQDALSKRVVITTPSTLLALLRTCALQWQPSELGTTALKNRKGAKPLSSQSIKLHLEQSSQRGRKPLLVVGSGLLAQLRYPNEVCSWPSLLTTLFTRCTPRATPESRKSFESLARFAPTHAWEWLVDQRSDERVSATKAEKLLAKDVRTLLTRLKKRRQDSKSAAWDHLPSALMKSRVCAIANLTFGFDPFAQHLNAAARGAGPARHRVGKLAPHIRLFQPHGDIASPSSLILGLRQYAGATTDWEQARCAFKSAERKVKSTPGQAGAMRAVEPETFVGHALKSPIVFIGCGLDACESTLWWLLATRLRNCARSVATNEPLAYFFTADEPTAAQRSRLEAMRCSVVVCGSHAESWSALLDCLGNETKSPPPPQKSSSRPSSGSGGRKQKANKKRVARHLPSDDQKGTSFTKSVRLSRRSATKSDTVTAF